MEKELELVWRSGCQGAFLSADGLGLPQFLRCSAEAASNDCGLWLGLRLPSVPDADELDSILDVTQNLWIDRLGPVADADAQADRIRTMVGWDGLLFGGLSLGAQPEDRCASAVAMSRLVDVVVATVASEHSAALRQAREIKHALGSFPFAIAVDSPQASMEGFARLADCLIRPERPGRAGGTSANTL